MARDAPEPSAGTEAALRDAATVILWREGAAGAEVLMGTRGARAAFMPNKVVFPGGAVDPGDAMVPLVAQPPEPCLRRLGLAPRPGSSATPGALLAAAVREVWEETGLVLGRPDAAPPPRAHDSAPWPANADWEGFAATGHRPDARAFRFVFRAVTPPGRPRRFDARFFLVPARAVQGDPDDFSRATEELSHLQWVPLAHAAGFDLPFVTRIVLSEIAPLIAAGGGAPPDGVPHVENDDVVSSVRRLD